MFEFIPAIDVLGGRVVRLERGDYNAVTVFGKDPVAVAQGFVAAGATLVHVVDLEGARSGVPDPSLCRAMGAADVAFQLGGGIRSAGEAAAAISDGASRVVVGTTAIWEPVELVRILDVVGAAALVVAVDVSDGRARGAGWLDGGRPVAEVLDSLAAAGVERILVTAIGRDGTMGGPDMELLALAAASGLGVIASGGVGSLEDVRTIVTSGVSGAIVGRAIYEGRFTVGEALEVVSQAGGR